MLLPIADIAHPGYFGSSVWSSFVDTIGKPIQLFTVVELITHSDDLL
jgi:hypothetical protein